MTHSSSDHVYTMADLKCWSEEGVSLAVLGHPVSHSLSPPMHNAAFAKLGERLEEFQKWRYYKFDIVPETLPEALCLFHKKRFQGLNLTLPHKVRALNCIECLDNSGKKMGAVNTLVWEKEGYRGYNTDGYGLEQALYEDLGAKFEGSTVILLGAGGAAQSAGIQAIQSGCNQLWIGNRSHQRLEALLAILIKEVGSSQRIEGFNFDNIPHDLPKEGIIINATSLGLQPDDPVPFELRADGQHLVFDMIYKPSPTPLIAQAKKLGRRASNGLGMLIWQGAKAFELWTGQAPMVDVMRAAANA